MPVGRLSVVHVAECHAGMPVSDVSHQSEAVACAPVPLDALVQWARAQPCQIELFDIDAPPVLWCDVPPDKCLRIAVVVVDQHACILVLPQKRQCHAGMCANTKLEAAN